MASTPTNQHSIEYVREILSRVLSAELDPVSGCRFLCGYRHNCPIQDEGIWLPLVGFESETDVYPVGEQRNRYSAKYLQKIDVEMQPYIQECWPAVRDSCEKLLLELGDGSI